MDNRLICDVDIEINSNEMRDRTKLEYIKHYLGIQFSPLPFLWHYDDFAQPFPVYGCKKISIYKLRSLIGANNNIFLDLNDKNTDVYILAQYKNEKVYYTETSNPNELYLSYHTWLYNNLTNTTSIKNNDINMKFKFLTQVQQIDGILSQNANYPYKNENKKSFGGIKVNLIHDKIIYDMRSATIHRHNGEIKFSGINVCNFNQNSDNAVFLSVIKHPVMYQKNEKLKILTKSKKSNCVVLHIFRNVADNNPCDNNYQELIKKYLLQ
jgi:hypothetical protein